MPYVYFAQQESAQEFLREAARVLRPGGAFVLVSNAAPVDRAQLLDRAEYGWVIDVYRLPRPPRWGGGARTCGEAWRLPEAPERVTKATAWQPPPPAAGGGGEQCVFAYVCTKQATVAKNASRK